jgi:general secretion pathway protein L
LAVFPLNAGSVAWAAWPEDRAVLAEPAVAAEAERLLGRPVQLVPQSQRWLSAAQGAWDLAQFELASSRSGRRWRQVSAGLLDIWQAPRWRVAPWAWAQQQEIKAKQERVKAILTSVFPHVKVVIDAPLQMRREVGQLRRGAGLGGTDDVDWMLSEVAQALAPGGGVAANTEAASVSGLEYSAGELRLQGLQLGEAARQNLRARLSAKGLEPSWHAGVLTVRPKGPA